MSTISTIVRPSLRPSASPLGDAVVKLSIVPLTIEVYSQPDTESGQYRTKATVDRAGSLTLQLPDGSFVLPASDVLP